MRTLGLGQRRTRGTVEPVVTHRAARVLASMSLLSLALFAGTGPASACPVTNPQCAVDGVKDAANDVKDTANNTVSGIKDQADDTVSGIKDQADDTVSGIKDQAEGTVEDVNETVENVKEKADGAVGEVEKTIDETVNPGGGDNPSRPNAPTEPGVGGPTRPKGKGGSQGPRGTRERSNGPGRGPRGDARERRAPGSALSRSLIAPIKVDVELDAPGSPVSSTMRTELSPGLGESAVEAIKDFAFPLVLTLVVGAFLLVQHMVDRKDPKLMFAPVDQDLLSFE